VRHDGHGDQQDASPIGVRLACWRARRGMSTDEVAALAGFSTAQLAALEGRRDWVDRYGALGALATALRLEPADLTGQPYPPTGREHQTVRAVAFHLRRELAETATASSDSLEELEARTAAVCTADAMGDEHALALAVPGLIRLGNTVTGNAQGGARERAAELRAHGHAAAAGLLRRLGYKDLAWLLLHRAGLGGPVPVAVLVEEVQLLIGLGLPEYALARAERAEAAGTDPQLPLLTAVAHAVAGRRDVADRLLGQAWERAADARAQAAASAARSIVAAEAGAPDEAVEHARVTDLGALEASQRVSVLVAAAAAQARLDHAEEAVAHLAKAESLAPWRVRLDPFARELLAVLPCRVRDAEAAEAARQMRSRCGIR
jgi:transcriptional regulator with XRE-family HTH domain